MANASGERPASLAAASPFAAAAPARPVLGLLGRYALAILAAVAAVLPRVAMQPLLGEQGRFLITTLAIAAVATFLGPGPAVVAIAFALLATLSLLVPVQVSISDATAITLFLLTSGAIVALAARLRLVYSEARRRGAEAARRANQLEAILRSMPDEVYVHDAQGRLIAANAPARARNPSGASLATLLARYGLDGPPLEAPVEAPDAEADGRWAEVTATGAIDAAATILVVHDITERRRDAERQQALAAMFSHELRTPLTIIAGNAALLKSRQLAEEVRADLLDGIDGEADRMRGLIDDLLVLARGSGAVAGAEVSAPEPVLLRPVIEEAVRGEAGRSGSEVELDLPADLPLVAADGDALAHVIRSLLANAAKYAPGAPIRVSASADDEGPVRVVVHDAGPGIPPGEEEAVFRLFYRSPAVRMTSGSGVGLFVSRALVESFGGHISASSPAEGGAAFTVELPRYVDEDAASEE